MSSKIKVDTIETVSGSGNVTVASGNALRVASGDLVVAGGNTALTGNLNASGTSTLQGNATVGGTLGVTGASTFSGDLQVGGSTPVSSAGIMSVVNAGNSLEWGHGNAAGYRSTLGALSGGGQPFIAFSAEHATNANLFRTRGLKGHVMGTLDNAGGMYFQALQNANADNQSPVTTMIVSNEGYVTQPKKPMFHISGTSAVSVSTHGTGALTYTSANSYNSGTEYDPDGHFNHSTGKFTAPVAGRYFFIFSIGVSYTSNYHYNYIRKNGGDVTGFSRNSAQNSDYLTNVIQGVLNLAANDTVSTGRNTNYNSGAINSPMFCGFLLG